MERYIPVKKQKKQRKNAGIKPGVYSAVVTSVVPSEGFVVGHAVDVIYAVNINDQIVEYSERFLVADQDSTRTHEFEALLNSIGADQYEDLVGIEFELTFAYEVVGKKAWCNIVDRTMLYEVEEDDDSNC